MITATGSKTNKVKDGINTRFDVGAMPEPPAPNVINYPIDDDLIPSFALNIGSGAWDLAGYWAAKHGGAGTPTALTDGGDASRYQVYLYEIGETFARFGKKTVYPVPGGFADPDYTTVTPPGPDLAVDAGNPTLPNFDDVPQDTPASNGPARRLVEVALLQCVADGIIGYGTYPTNGKYVEMFITQEVKDPPNAAIYAEIVRSLSSFNDPVFHANAALIE